MDAYGLHAFGVRAHECIFVKYGNDAFEGSILSRHLASRNISHPIIAGMNTGACVADTIQGGIRQEFSFAAACDLLADSNEPAKENHADIQARAAWHSAKLATSLRWDIGAKYGTDYEDFTNDWVDLSTSNAITTSMKCGNFNLARPRRPFPGMPGFRRATVDNS